MKAVSQKLSEIYEVKNSVFRNFLIDRRRCIYRERDGIYDVYIASRPGQTIRGRKLSEGLFDLKSIGVCHKIREKIFQVSFGVTMTSYI